MPEKNLKLVHFQLTRQCNLSCPFCGQWGKHGYMRNHSAPELSTGEWLRIIDQAVEYREQTGISPQFVIWGGEPLISQSFPAVAQKLKECGFDTALVTNGILLETFAGIINETVNTVYVSLDGPEEIHETVRGRKNIYAKIMRGIAAINKQKVSLVNLFTLCEYNYHIVAEFPFQLKESGFSKMMVQNLIYCSSSQAASYRHWFKDSFGQDALSINSWVTDHFGNWTEKLPEAVAEIKHNIADGIYPIEVELFPYELNESNIGLWFKPEINLKQDASQCLMPYRHLHINADGETHFCVDFSDFSLGRIQESSLTGLFFSDPAEKFRAECTSRNTLCGRCPWYYNKSLTIDKK